jgi:hypothetical protein
MANGRPKFEATDEIKNIVRNGSMIGHTWDQITHAASFHLQKIYKEKSDDYDRLSQLSKKDVELPDLSKYPRSVSKKTLQRHCQKDYDDSKPILEQELTNVLMRNARNGHPASLFFVLKTRFGWKETSKHELTGKDGHAIESNGLLKFVLTLTGPF